MRHLAALLWRLPVATRRTLLFTTAGLLLALVVRKFSGGLFRGPADLLTSVLCALFVLLAAFAAVAWVLRIFGVLVSAAPAEGGNGGGGDAFNPHRHRDAHLP